MDFNRRNFLKGISLSAAGAAALPLAAREGMGPMVKEDAEPVTPGALPVVAHIFAFDLA